MICVEIEPRKDPLTGAATFLVKVKAHRGEPLNELADAREAAKEHREWIDRTDWMVFQWEEEKGTRRSVWTAGVRKAVRKGAGQFVVKSTREKRRRGGGNFTSKGAAKRAWGGG